MSTVTEGPATHGAATRSLPRALALAGGAALTGSYLAVLHDVTSVVGGSTLLLAVVLGALALAIALAETLRPRMAAALGLGLLGAGIFVYLSAVPLGWRLLFNLSNVVVDVLALLSGISVLRMTQAGAWAIGLAPAPVFLSWYLLLRGRYALGVGVGGTALLAFALTGDAGSTVALTGAVGAAAALGFGEIDRRRGTTEEMEVVAAVLALMVMATVTVSMVPGGEASPFVPEKQSPTIEGGVLNAGDRVSVVGSIRLSPEVRFVVESNQPAYWRTGAYDRYTGQGWVRSGQSSHYDGRLSGPPGRTERVTQTVRPETDLGVVPAAWRPIRVDGDVTDRLRVTSLGGIVPTSAITDEETYTVVSEKPVTSEQRLREAGTDYPADVEERFTQLPESTSARLVEFTDQLTADAESPYETALQVERWLENNKRYSLDVQRPEGDIADSFVFEMDAGYCVYYATAMVAMLRTQGIPARFVVGYATGQRVDADTWVVRELDSHAWVEVYFPDVGWVKFDPTPSGPRESAEQDRVEEARENDTGNVDAAGSQYGTWTPTPGPGSDETADPTDPGERNDPSAVATLNGTDDPRLYQDLTPGAGGNGGSSNGPPRAIIGFGFLVVVGVIAGIRRTDAIDRAQWMATVYWQRTRRSPELDVQRAYDRLEHVLHREYRPRRTGETRRRYLRTIYTLERDDRIHRVGELYLRARYGGDVSREEAEESIELVDDIVREHTPILRRLLN